MKSRFKFTAGPWNVNEGVEAFGPGVRETIDLEAKVKKFAEIGLSGVQFHDDDAVPDMNNMSEKQIVDYAKDVKSMLDKYGMTAEFVAPRLWMDPHTTDGGFTSNSKEDYEFAMWRAKRSIDIANALGAKNVVLWLAREGTLCAESKDPVEKIGQLITSIDEMLAYDPKIKILIESKPNEPIDRSYCGTIGHVMAVSAASKDPSRVGAVLESAHAILAGLDPANEMAFALKFGKLGSVHLNDQNGCRYDQDKTFGSENLRNAFNQIKVLCDHNYGANGEMVGLDVKAMRTQKPDDQYRHIQNSMKLAMMMEQKVEKFDRAFQAECIKERNYEKLEMYVMELLLTD
ncbi:TIM barrel protein [Diplocloster hominis]|uniref:TIM barrel protein n=1 Tax=Diplocloster hominis TaxID=3079010 RepID=UPI0031BAE4A0